MGFVRIQLPPGVFKNGTKYQARNRWFDSQLVRWVDDSLQPIGGWQHKPAAGAPENVVAEDGSTLILTEGGDELITEDGADETDDINLGEPPLGIHTWRSNDGKARFAVGTPTRAWTFVEGAMSAVTPAGFTSGSADASISLNYGSGVYGIGNYGEGDVSQASITEAQSWQFDNFGQILVAVAQSDGVLYKYDYTSDSRLVEVDPSAPTDNAGVVVTPERFLVALGADGEGRKVQWADQESLTTWTAAATNQAGDFILPGSGSCMMGARTRGETLIWTTTDLFAMRFIGGTLVYQFEEVGSNCGPISRRAATVVDGGRAFWMGTRNFFVYDGFVKPIRSDVADFVFSDINNVQESKVHAASLTEFNEIWWFYPSAGSTEIDRYVVYNYRDDSWYVGQLNRTCMADRGAFTYPLAGDNQGSIYDHERGNSYDDPDDNTLTPSAETGPIEIAPGDNWVWVRKIVPDEDTLGDVRAKLFSAPYPTADETEHGPFTLSNPTSVRVSGRQVRLEVEQVSPDWRVGTFRLDVVPGEGR